MINFLISLGLITIYSETIIVQMPPTTTIVSEKPVESVVEGLASYYSRAGCLGCSPTLTMANGEPLDDNKLTVAYNRAPLNSYIEITNPKTGEKVTARVTDRGGFERHGKIVDLSVATKKALGCGDVCKVIIKSGYIK